MEKTIWVNGAEFILVEVSKLNLLDDFMHHTPKTDQEKAFKELLTEVIKSGVSDFYRPRLDPSLDRQGRICYQAGLKPALGQTYRWWKNNAKEFCPGRKSRLGTNSEYVAFLGDLLKKLVASGWSITDAWNAVCNNSRKLGHYWDSKGALFDFETTGSREICGFCDLGNARKILDDLVVGFWCGGGTYDSFGYYSPLAKLICFVDPNNKLYYSVGWIVLEK